MYRIMKVAMAIGIALVSGLFMRKVHKRLSNKCTLTTDTLESVSKTSPFLRQRFRKFRYDKQKKWLERYIKYYHNSSIIGRIPALIPEQRKLYLTKKQISCINSKIHKMVHDSTPHD